MRKATKRNPEPAKTTKKLTADELAAVQGGDFVIVGNNDESKHKTTTTT